MTDKCQLRYQHLHLSRPSDVLLIFSQHHVANHGNTRIEVIITSISALPYAPASKNYFPEPTRRISF